MDLTLRDPNLIEQERLSCGEGGAEPEHMGEEGQSPHEQPSEVSLHE